MKSDLHTKQGTISKEQLVVCAEELLHSHISNDVLQELLRTKPQPLLGKWERIPPIQLSQSHSLVLHTPYPTLLYQNFRGQVGAFCITFNQNAQAYDIYELTESYAQNLHHALLGGQK
ncbi:MAG: hypothetical protein ACI8Y7_000436 [Candidatus Woesearchaeota archaeon]|jgi:hypothetical protein